MFGRKEKGQGTDWVPGPQIPAAACPGGGYTKPMTIPLDAPAPPPRKPQASPFWRGLMRLTGTLAIALFLAPTVYVVKYYSADLPRERQRARLISTSVVAPSVPLSAVAPPLSPPLNANAAEFYVPAIQSYADRTRAHTDSRLLVFPNTREAALLLQGARCNRCQFFALSKSGRPRFAFLDPDDGALHPYRAPLSAHETYRYLSYAGALAQATKNLALVPDGPLSRQTLARMILRFGGGLENEPSTRTHIAVSTAIQRLGLRLLRDHPPAAFQRYVDARQTYDEAVQAKYALLEPVNPDNIALQERVARTDAAPLWRREGVWALGQTLSVPWISLRRPLETLTAKETLGSIATHDPDPAVRAAASATLGEVASQGAVIRR